MIKAGDPGSLPGNSPDGRSRSTAEQDSTPF